ncbi:MAG: hypothetical protein JW786_04445 [Desulfobacterales bacterium]|nr:hypothetical protein [Desulfobacterales bacterium]
MLEDTEGPVLEVKWNRIKGFFSSKAYLRQLAAFYKRHFKKKLTEFPLPDQWANMIGNGYQARCFSWQGKNFGGKGIILYCTICQNATLIQFYHKAASNRAYRIESLLSSFQDHRIDDQIFWSIFDIQATIPVNFQLVRYQFEAGKFELAFASKGQKIILYRWALTSILQCEQDFVQFAEAMTHLPKKNPNYRSLKSCKGLEWEIVSPKAFWRRYLYWPGEKTLFQWVRIWQVEEKNRILGIRAEGKKAFDPFFLERICTNYEAL